MPLPAAEVVRLGASEQNATSRAIGWQCINPVTAEDDFEDFGVVDVMQGLGVTSAAWPSDAAGYAEAIILRNAGNRNAIAIGGRDTRSAKALGTVRPGDTILHSTGPQQAAQVQCKESKRQVVLYTKDSEDSGMVVMLDGKADKFQILARGAMIEIDKEGDISILNGGGASILLQGDHIFLNGNIHLAGMPPGMVLMAGPPTGSTGGPTSAPLVPVLGIGK